MRIFDHLQHFIRKLFKAFHQVPLEKIKGGVLYPDLKFLIIRRNWTGLMTYVQKNLGWIAFAEKNGFIPVIDMMNYPSPYQDPTKTGINAWELYFKQPQPYTLDQAMQSKNVWQTPLGSPPDFYTSRDIIVGGSRLDKWSELYQRTIQFNEKTAHYLQTEYQQLIPAGARVLGVACRGTDYVQKQPKNHPIQPTVDEMIQKVQEVFEKWRCDWIYLSTEEYHVVEQFEANFPRRVIINKRQFFDQAYSSEKMITEVTFKREDDAYLQGLEYLSSVNILSRCTSLVAGLHGASYAAALMNNGCYENVYFFDLGKY